MKICWKIKKTITNDGYSFQIVFFISFIFLNFNIYYILIILLFYNLKLIIIIKWGLGIGDWGLGIGDWGEG